MPAVDTRPEKQIEPIVIDAAGGGAYRGLAAAIRQAPAGAVLHIRPGIYDETEAMIVDRPLELRGLGPIDQVVIILKSAFRIAADARFAGLTLIGRASADENALAAATLYFTGGQSRLENCIIRAEAASGVGVAGPDTRLTLHGCKITDAADSGVLAAEARALSLKNAKSPATPDSALAVQGAEIAVYMLRRRPQSRQWPRGPRRRPDHPAGLCRSCQCSSRTLWRFRMAS